MIYLVSTHLKFCRQLSYEFAPYWSFFAERSASYKYAHVREIHFQRDLLVNGVNVELALRSSQGRLLTADCGQVPASRTRSVQALEKLT
jgi:hypothetical protein